MIHHIFLELEMVKGDLQIYKTLLQELQILWVVVIKMNQKKKLLHIDKLKVPSAKFQLPISKSYFGLKEMMNSELAFLKATVFSKSKEPVIMYSDMPMGEMAKDPNFPKMFP